MTDKQIDKHIPRLRFHEFQNDDEWTEKSFGDCLEYEQPQPYLVSSDNYKKTGTPVLTAGKTFVLGYTDEITGIYNHLPVIIFDDFTTASKFVDFPFKAKSSAMKMLQNRSGYDLRFMFETIQKYKFEPKDHQRHWISIFSQFRTLVPSYSEQQKIAECLSSIYSYISSINEKIEQLKAHKKSLLQKLFPQNGKTVPEYRFPEFRQDGEWKRKNLKEIITVNSGRDYKHLDAGEIPVYGTGGYMLSVNDKLSDIDAVGIGRKGTIDKPQYLKAPFWTVDTLFFLTSIEGYDIEFVYYLAQNIPWKKYGEQTGVPSLSKLSIENLEVLVPANKAEQKRISTMLSSLDYELFLLEKKMLLLKTHKNGLVQQLFPPK